MPGGVPFRSALGATSMTPGRVTEETQRRLARAVAQPGASMEYLMTRMIGPCASIASTRRSAASAQEVAGSPMTRRWQRSSVSPPPSRTQAKEQAARDHKCSVTQQASAPMSASDAHRPIAGPRRDPGRRRGGAAWGPRGRQPPRRPRAQGYSRGRPRRSPGPIGNCERSS